MTDIKVGDKLLVEVEVEVTYASTHSNYIEVETGEGNELSIDSTEAFPGKITKINPPFKVGDIVQNRTTKRIFSLLEKKGDSFVYFSHQTHQVGGTHFFSRLAFEVLAGIEEAA